MIFATTNNIKYSPSLFVYNTQKKLYTYFNTSFFSIFERLLRLFFYVSGILNILIFNIFLLYLFFYITILFFFLIKFNLKRQLNS